MYAYGQCLSPCLIVNRETCDFARNKTTGVNTCLTNAILVGSSSSGRPIHLCLILNQKTDNDPLTYSYFAVISFVVARSSFQRVPLHPCLDITQQSSKVSQAKWREMFVPALFDRSSPQKLYGNPCRPFLSLSKHQVTFRKHMCVRCSYLCYSGLLQRRRSTG